MSLASGTECDQASLQDGLASVNGLDEPANDALDIDGRDDNNNGCPPA